MKTTLWLQAILMINNTATPLMNNQVLEHKKKINTKQTTKNMQILKNQLLSLQKQENIDLQDITTIILKSDLDTKLKIKITRILNQQYIANLPGPMSPHAIWKPQIKNNQHHPPLVTIHNVDISSARKYRPTIEQWEKGVIMELDLISWIFKFIDAKG